MQGLAFGSTPKQGISNYRSGATAATAAPHRPRTCTPRRYWLFDGWFVRGACTIFCGPPRHLVSILWAPLGCPEVSALKYCTPLLKVSSNRSRDTLRTPAYRADALRYLQVLGDRRGRIPNLRSHNPLNRNTKQLPARENRLYKPIARAGAYPKFPGVVR